MWTAAIGGVLLLSILRLYSLFRSDKWIWVYGRAYAEEHAELYGDVLPEQREALYDKYHGNYFPFGVKGYRLARWARQLPGWAWPVSAILRVARRLWGFYFFCPIVSAFLVIAGTVRWGGSAGTVTLGKDFGLALCYVLILWSILIAVEAVLAYIRIRSWGALYHGMSHKDVSINGGSLSEIQVAVGAALMAAIGSSAAFYFIAARFNAFNLIQDSSVVARIGDSIFYSLLTLIQAGDPDATKGPGKTAVVLTSVTGLTFVVAVAGLVVAYIGSPPTMPGRPPATQPAKEEAEVVEKEHKRASLIGGAAAVAAVIVVRAIRKY